MSLNVYMPGFANAALAVWKLAPGHWRPRGDRRAQRRGDGGGTSKRGVTQVIYRELDVRRRRALMATYARRT
jgi:hypothetical protein